MIMESRWKSMFSLKRSPRKNNPTEEDDTHWSRRQETINQTWMSQGSGFSHTNPGHDISTLHSFNVYPDISESSKFHDMDISNNSKFQSMNDSSLNGSSMWRAKSQPSVLRSPTLDISEIVDDANESKQKSSRFGWLRKSLKKKSKSDVKKAEMTMYGNNTCKTIDDRDKKTQPVRCSPPEDEWCTASPRACQALKLQGPQDSSRLSDSQYSLGQHRLSQSSRPSRPISMGDIGLRNVHNFAQFEVPKPGQPQQPQQHVTRHDPPPQHVIKQKQPQQHVIKPHQPQQHVIKPQQPQQHVIKPQQPQQHVIKPQQPQQHVIKPQQPQQHVIKPQQPQQPQQHVIKPQQPQQHVIKPQQPQQHVITTVQPQQHVIKPQQPQQPQQHVIKPQQPQQPQQHVITTVQPQQLVIKPQQPQQHVIKPQQNQQYVLRQGHPQTQNHSSMVGQLQQQTAVPLPHQSQQQYNDNKCVMKENMMVNMRPNQQAAQSGHNLPRPALQAHSTQSPDGHCWQMPPTPCTPANFGQARLQTHENMNCTVNSGQNYEKLKHTGHHGPLISRNVHEHNAALPSSSSRNYENIPCIVKTAQPNFPAPSLLETAFHVTSSDHSVSPHTQRLPPQGESDSSGSVLLKSCENQRSPSREPPKTVSAKSSDIAELYQQHGMWRVWSQPNLGDLDLDQWPSPIEQVPEIFQGRSPEDGGTPTKKPPHQTSTPSPRQPRMVSSAPTTPVKKGSDHNYENLPPMATPSRRWRNVKKAKSHYVLGLQTHKEDPLNESDEENKPYFPKSSSHPSILDSDGGDYCEIHGHTPRGRHRKNAKSSSPFHSPSSRSSSGSSLSPERTLRSRSKSSRSRSSNSRSRSRHSKSRSRSRATDLKENEYSHRPEMPLPSHATHAKPHKRSQHHQVQSFGDAVHKSKSHGNLGHGSVAPDIVPSDDNAISCKTKRSWATLNDIPSAVIDDDDMEWNVDGHGYSAMDVSMATTASYIPGASLADKLRLAASKGQNDKVCELVKAGATFQPDREGRTALHYAALNGYADVVKYLSDQGCDIDLQDNLGYTALHRAAAQGHLDVIRVLLNEGCLLDRQDEVHGNSALHEAAWNGYSRTLEVLVKHHANVLITNKAGFTALHLAAQNGHNQSARVLLYANCLPDMKNNYGDTAIHTAARYGHAGVTRILVSAKCNINEQNKNGDTALHISAALKRRKIAKLLTESLININLKNKQNESAVDVARRKDYPEIILIITSQPKTKQRKKKFGKGKSEKEKMIVEMSEDSEKKEKKGFFFRKKAKTKLEKEKSSTGAVAAGTTTAASEVSSFAHFNHEMHPQQLLLGFRNHQQRQSKNANHSHNPAHKPPQYTRAHERQAPAGSSAGSVRGILNNYVPKEGVQYYRDLAGNIKQGPVGFAPVCSCAPGLKRLEQRVDADRANLYDHIDASHRTLTDRIDTLDRRTSQQVYAIDKLTKERLDAERKDREEHMETRFLRERLQTERQMELQQDCIQTEVKAWVEGRLTTFERNYGDAEGLADYGPSLRTIHRYKSLSKKRLQGNGLYRSRSDETLSISSSHPSKRHFKMRQKTMQEMKKLRMPNVHRRAAKFEEKVHGLTVRDKPQGNGYHGRPLTFHEDMKVPSGRSPEGHVGEVAFCEVEVHNNQWGTQHIPRNCVNMRQYQEGDGKPNNDGLQQIQNDLSSMCIRDGDNSALSDTYAQTCRSESSLDNGPRLHLPSGTYAPHSSFVATKFNEEYSPESNTGSQSKGDSASNPDSGYGSKIYGVHPPSKSTSASFGGSSTGSHDHHDSSIITNASNTTDGSSPATYASVHSDGDIRPVSRHIFGTVSNQMEKWYERRLKDGEHKTNERIVPDSHMNIPVGNRHEQRVQSNGIEFCGHATEV